MVFNIKISSSILFVFSFVTLESHVFVIRDFLLLCVVRTFMHILYEEFVGTTCTHNSINNVCKFRDDRAFRLTLGFSCTHFCVCTYTQHVRLSHMNIYFFKKTNTYALTWRWQKFKFFFSFAFVSTTLVFLFVVWVNVCESYVYLWITFFSTYIERET